MTNTTKSSREPGTSPALPTLATLLAALESHSGLSETRRRDLRSAVKRVAHLLGNTPVAIPLAMDTIREGLGGVNPIAAGLLATQLVGEPITPNLVLGLIAVFAGIWIATSEIKRP